MSNKTFALVGFLCSAWVIPLTGQGYDELDLKNFNYNIGGGFSVPINPTARNFGVDGNFTTGAGTNFTSHNSIEGDFMWAGLPTAVSLIRPVNGPTGDAFLIALMGDYRLRFDHIRDSRYGVYVLGGGGWYYRHFSVDRHFVVPALTPCQPIFFWWGFACNGGFVDSRTVLTHASSAGGVNGGAGFTVRMDDGWSFFAEARYHYAWSQFIPTTLTTVTFGFRFH
jgi:hypothetical protein